MTSAPAGAATVCPASGQTYNCNVPIGTRPAELPCPLCYAEVDVDRVRVRYSSTTTDYGRARVLPHVLAPQPTS